MSKQFERVNAMGLVISNLQDGAYFYSKGIEAYREKNINKAKRYLERAVQLDAKEPSFLCQLAVVHADLGNYQRSNLYLKKVIDENLAEDLPECHYFLANNYANLGLFEHARKEALLYIEKDSEGDFLEEAEDLLEFIQDEDELFAEAEDFLIRYELASHELKKENYIKAIEYFNDIIKEEPKYWMAHIRLAEAHYNMKNTKKAIDILKAVLTKEDNITARCNLMIYYFETGQKEQANKILQLLKNVWSFDYLQAYQIGVCFGKVGEHELAYQRLECLGKKGFGNFPKFVYQLAVASYYTGRIQKAIKLWEKLATLGNNDAIHHLNTLEEGLSLEPTYYYNATTVE